MVTGNTHTAIVTYIQEVLQSVSGINDNGKILTRPRDITELGKVQEIFAAEGTTGELLFNAWIIERDGIDSVRQGAPKGQEFRFSQYLVRAYHTMNDELNTELTFQDLLTEVMDAFVPAIQVSTEGGTATNIEALERARVRVITVDDFAGHVCHYAELELLIRERMKNFTYYQPA